MLTFDELVYAGGGNISNSNYYLNNNATTNYWWALSPSGFLNVNFDSVDSFGVFSNGNVDNRDVGLSFNHAFRPVVTLLSSTQISGGNGTISSPYVVS